MTQRRRLFNRVLVTGATGFIGGRLVEVLCDEDLATVRIFVRNPARMARIARYPTELSLGDLLDADSVEAAARDCDVIFHCAYGNGGLAEVQERINEEGTRNVIRAAAAAGVERVVHVSTVEVYEPIDGQLDESCSRYSGSEPYGRSKLRAEQIALTEGAASGVAVSVVQPTVVYGPFGTMWSEGPLNMLASGHGQLIDDGQGLCNAVYIDDLIDAMLRCAVHPKAIGEAFLISGPTPVRWSEFMGAYAGMIGLDRIRGVSAEEALRRWRASSAEGSLSYLWRSWRDDAVFRETTRGIPAIAAVYRLGHKLISEDVWGRLRGRAQVKDLPASLDSTSGDSEPSPATSVMGPGEIAFYQRRTAVSIDKAHRMLDYDPQFDLSAGMERTRWWAEWARFIPVVNVNTGIDEEIPS
jgi:nucleoside-diphosphate-sugar epimerase